MIFKLRNETNIYLIIGIQLVLMTLLFEFFFGYYVLNNSWTDLVQVFNLLEGNLYILS